MTAQEHRIAFETEHFYAYMLGDKVQIRLKRATHALVVGETSTLEQARRFVDRCELYPHKLYLLESRS